MGVCNVFLLGLFSIINAIPIHFMWWKEGEGTKSGSASFLSNIVRYVCLKHQIRFCSQSKKGVYKSKA